MHIILSKGIILVYRNYYIVLLRKVFGKFVMFIK